jgi:hypothetical protein
MRKLIILALVAVAGCSSTPMAEPSLAPRAAESIDPRVPIPETVPTGNVDAALAQRLDALVNVVRGAAPQFSAREAETSRLTATAGPVSSESWIAAQQALSRLVEQHGITTGAAADIDAMAANRIEGQRWIRPADRNAIAAAAAEVGEINQAQSAAIDRLRDRLAR